MTIIPRLMRGGTRTAILAGLMLLTVLAYAPGMRGEFVLDDQVTVESNRGIRDLGQFLGQADWSSFLQSNRIFTELTFALDYAIGKLDPLPFHATNLAIHLAMVLLVYAFVRKLLDLSGLVEKDHVSLAVAGLFALHPLQTQAVIYVSQRAESLASAFYLGALLLLLEAERRGRTWAGVFLFVGSLTILAVGLGSKSIALTLPLAYLLTGALPSRTARADKLARPSQRLALVAPFFCLVFLVIWRTLPGLSIQAQPIEVAVAGFALRGLPPWRYFLTEWHVVATYLRLLLWPSGQNIDWDFPLAQGPGDLIVLACGAFLASLISGAGYLLFRCRHRLDRAGAIGRTAAFGVLWFFLVLSQSSSVVPRIDVLFEHRLYLASFGIYLAAVSLVDHALRGLSVGMKRRLAAGLAVLVCGSLATLTYLRASVWKSKLLLWSEVVEKSPRKARGHLNLAEVLRKSGQPQRAVEECQVALSLANDDPKWIRTNARGELAAALYAESRPAEAIAVLKAALEEDPDDGGLWGALAVMHFQQDELPQAEAAAERYVRANDHLPAAFRVQGFVRMRRKDYVGGTEAFERALWLEPDEPQNAILVAEAYRTQGRAKEACDLLHSAKGSNQQQNPLLDEALHACDQP